MISYFWTRLFTFPVDHGVDSKNHMDNEPALAANRPIKRVREAESVCRQRELPVSMNTILQSNDMGHLRTLLNPNPVSTGLELSCQEEQNSSLLSAGENTRSTLSGVLSLGNSVKLELDRQTAEFDRYMDHQVQLLKLIFIEGTLC